MILKEGELFDIRYTKTGTEEVTDRIVIPTTVPRNIKAIDVTGLTLEERKLLRDQYVEYREYVKMRMAAMYTFEDYMDHIGVDRGDIQVKWRTFKLEQTQVL